MLTALASHTRWAALFVLVMLGFFLALTLPGANAATGEAANDTPSLLGDTASWALILGILAPLVTSVVQQPKWSKRTRTIVALLASIVIGVITVLANGGFDGPPQSIISIIALVAVSSAAAHKSIWQPMGVTPAIENATSLSSSKETGTGGAAYYGSPDPHRGD